MPSPDFSSAINVDPSTLSHSRPYLASCGTEETSRGKTQNLPCINARFIKHTPCGWRTSLSRASSFHVYHTSYLVPVPRPGMFGLGFLQTPSRDDALAFLLPSGSANTWREDLHLASSVPCPAHTVWLTGSDTKPSPCAAAGWAAFHAPRWTGSKRSISSAFFPWIACHRSQSS